MSFKTITGLVLLLIGGLAIGWWFGGRGYGLFEKTVPAGAVTELVRTGTKGAYISGGILLGFVIFGWTVVVALVSRFFVGGSAAKPPAAK